jgi:hypothetical protein
MKNIQQHLVVSAVKELLNFSNSGEELETLINMLGMEEQMLRQLALKADVDTLKQLIEEKEELEANKTQVYNIDEYYVVQIDLLYKGIEYSVEIRSYSDGNVVHKVSDLVTGDELHQSSPIVNELNYFVKKEIQGEI